MSLLDALIAQGMKNNEVFTKELIEIKKRVENTKEVQAIAALKDVTDAMQSVDDFTLTQSVNTQMDTENMKQVDDFTLQEVMKHEDRIAVLESKVNGGNA
jgi:propanediol dehydratase small subunit